MRPRPPELSLKMPPYNTVPIDVGSRELSRARTPHEIDVAVTSPVGGVEGHHAHWIQHQIYGDVPAAARWANGTHARLRAGVAEAALRAAAPLVSSATLRRNASMRLTTRCGGAKGGPVRDLRHRQQRDLVRELLGPGWNRIVVAALGIDARHRLPHSQRRRKSAVLKLNSQVTL